MPTVFLSYASEANTAPGDKESQGWVSFFDRCLKIELGRLRDVSLWRDARLAALIAHKRKEPPCAKS